MKRFYVVLILFGILAFWPACVNAADVAEPAEKADPWIALYGSIAGIIGDAVKMLLALLFAWIANKLKIKIDKDDAMDWAQRGAAYAEKMAAKKILEFGTEKAKPKAEEKLALAQSFIEKRAPAFLQKPAKELIEAAIPFVLEEATEAIERIRYLKFQKDQSLLPMAEVSETIPK